MKIDIRLRRNETATLCFISDSSQEIDQIDKWIPSSKYPHVLQTKFHF